MNEKSFAKAVAVSFILCLVGGFLFVANAYSATTLYKTWTTQGDFENNDVSQQRPTTRINVDTASSPGDVVLSKDGNSSISLIGDPFVVMDYATSMGNAPLIAYNSLENQFLVVTDFFAQIVNDDGTIAGSIFQVRDSGSAYQDIAYNPLANQYIIVWSSGQFVYDADGNWGTYDIFGQIVNADGTLGGPAFSISTMPASQIKPSVAFNSVTGQYLVAWSDNYSGWWDIYGQIVNSDGSLSGSEIAIATSYSAHKLDSNIEYNSELNEFMIVWGDSLGGTYDISAQRVGAEGNLVGTKISVSNMFGTFKGYSGVVYNPVSNQYMVTWMDGRNRGFNYYDIYAQIVNADGSLEGSDIAVSVGIGSNTKFYPEITCNSISNQYLVVWMDGNYNESGPSTYNKILGQIIDAGGGLNGAPVTVIYNPESIYTMSPNVSYSPHMNEYMALWVDLNLFGGQTRSNRIGQPFITQGTITNLKINSGVKTPFWRKIWWNTDTPEGTSVRFRTRSARNESALSNAEWTGPYTSSGSDVIAGKTQWLEIEMRLETTDPGSTPVVHDFTIEYSNTK